MIVFRKGAEIGMSCLELKELAKRKQWSELEQAWLEAIEKTPGADPAQLLAVIDVVVKEDKKDLAATMGWAWLSVMKENHSPREALQLGRGLLLRLPDGEQLRDEILALYVQTHSDRNDLDWWVEQSGLKSGKSVRRALRFLDTGLKLEAGTGLYHRTEEEAARIVAVDQSADEIELKTAKRPRLLSFEQVIEEYDVVDKHDYRVLRQLEPSRIAELAQKDPAALIVGILRCHDNQLDRDSLKLMLVPAFVASDAWSSWWTRVRSAVKKSSQLRIEGRSPMMLMFDEVGRTLEEESRDALNKTAQPRAWLEILEAYLRETKRRKTAPDSAFLDGVQKALIEKIDRFLGHKEPGGAFATALVIERVAADGLPISTDVHTTALKMLADAANPMSLVAMLPDQRLWSLGLQCVKQAFPDLWTEQFAELCLYAPLSVIDGLAATVEKTGRGELLAPMVERALADPGRHTDTTMWLWKGPSIKTQLPIPPLLEMFNMIIALVGPARMSEGKVTGQTESDMRAKVRAGLGARNYARFRVCIDEQSPEMAPAIRRLVERADGLGPTVRDEMLAILRKRFPHLYAQKKVEMWADESIVYFTEAGLRSRRDEIDKLVNVKMRENAKAIGEAAAHGDLSENAEYKFALEERDLLRARLAQLNADMALAKVLEPDQVPTDHVSIGQRVVVCPNDGGQAVVLTVLGAGESEVGERVYSYQTPIAQSIMGKRIGDAVTLQLDGQESDYRVEQIENVLSH